MAKKQIKITQSDIRRMIREAIHSYSFNGEGFNDKPDNEYDMNGNKRYPEGKVFSTDSKEGEALKAQAEKYGFPRKSEDNAVIWDSDKKRDMIARDEFGDEEQESERYDKPFGDLDDVENQWEDEPGYEDEEEKQIGPYEVYEGRQIRLNEEGLRNFISYSVARLLKEGFEEGNRGMTVHFGNKESEEAAKRFYSGSKPANNDGSVFFNIQSIMQWLQTKADEIENSYVEAEEDPSMSDDYKMYEETYKALERFVEYGKETGLFR